MDRWHLIKPKITKIIIIILVIINIIIVIFSVLVGLSPLIMDYFQSFSVILVIYTGESLPRKDQR